MARLLKKPAPKAWRPSHKAVRAAWAAYWGGESVDQMSEPMAYAEMRRALVAAAKVDGVTAIREQGRGAALGQQKEKEG